MAPIRVPFPVDPQQRDDLFARAAAKLGNHGTFQGTAEAGTFQGWTPVGRFAGSYRTCTQAGVLEIHLTRKPLLIPTSMIEHELRRLLAQMS